MRAEKRHYITSGIGFAVYELDGRFFLDFHRPNEPIHSYETIDGVKEALYYAGYISSKEETI